MAFDPIRTNTNTYPFIDKEKGKRLGKDPQRSGKITANHSFYFRNNIGGYEPMGVKWRGQRMFGMKGWITGPLKG